MQDCLEIRGVLAIAVFSVRVRRDRRWDRARFFIIRIIVVICQILELESFNVVVYIQR